MTGTIETLSAAPAARGAWLQTYTGRAFFPQSPSIADIDIADIAHGLANSSRFNGQCGAFYSIAQHSLLVSDIAGEMLPAMTPGGERGTQRLRMTALAGLLHDAAEAYVGDMVAPLKMVLPDFARIEQLVEDAIAQRFGLSNILGARGRCSTIRQAVKRADLVALATERRDLMAPAPYAWVEHEKVEPRAERIVPWLPGKAKERFLMRFFALTDEQAA